MEFVEVGYARRLFIYPVKSMRGPEVESLTIVKTGPIGDRNGAFVKKGVISDFPWFTGRDWPELLRYTAQYANPANPKKSLIMVGTPEGQTLPFDSEELAAELSRKSGKKVETIRRGAGLPDSMAVSLLGLSTLKAVAQRVQQDLVVERFRPNILVETSVTQESEEDRWVGGLLKIGDRDDSPILAVVERNQRCVMINIDPLTAVSNPQVLKEVGKSRDVQMGIYASVVKPGIVRKNDLILLGRM